MADKLKFLAAIAVIAAAISGYYYYADESMLLRILAILAALGVSVAIMMQTATGRDAWAFIGGARNEVRKVVWPTRKETVQTTMIVMAMVLLIAIILSGFDWLLSSAVKMLTGQGG